MSKPSRTPTQEVKSDVRTKIDESRAAAVRLYEEGDPKAQLDAYMRVAMRLVADLRGPAGGIVTLALSELWYVGGEDTPELLDAAKAILRWGIEHEALNDAEAALISRLKVIASSQCPIGEIKRRVRGL